MIERSQTIEQLENNERIEIERKFLALDSTVFDQYRPLADKITQIYLSHPMDEYSLRLRELINPSGDTIYTATLKDRGALTPDGLSRVEVETAISKEAFEHYSNKDVPRLCKDRVEICEGVTVDWINGSDTPIVEVEHNGSPEFLSIFSNDLLERTGHSDVDNESLAHAIFDGEIKHPPAVTPEQIVQDILAFRSIGQQQIVVGIGGRSGSGKTTLTRLVQSAIAEHPELQTTATLVSTDDYHVGRKYLETTYDTPWTNWEDARVYNTALLAEDIANWREGQPLTRRWFDFSTEEPAFGEALPRSDILIVEGIHASSRDLAPQRQIFYETSTPLSVALGRDLKRLIATNRNQAAMKSPEERLRYILEIGEPTYETVDHAPRNSFSGCARQLGKRALGQGQ